ncbi:AraC family transcriptional regulator [Sinomicrobium weinanense]|uniref:Helix-turn-helix transcriptional regulator n=1 Tax=Sinomicrobium weinanense TaxID=2842200 RepID=A0A926JSW0_9FLAO|nr:AraC family transcriptional regulator [Sinomicrobium weinanense]MBC9796907.1 helix-turn-helix transcriptional regulator [Sinomicrobium weinanense]MBU3124215.1 AraC family transcriptional regulator [Sinomicrobium weinanense]
MNDLEYISIENQASAFPEHYHETFCISLIHSGVEAIKMEEKTIYGEAGSITITNPYEVHSNPLVDPGVKLRFDTLYITGGLMKYLFDGENITFLQRKIRDQKAEEQFVALRNSFATGDTGNSRAALVAFARTLRPYSRQKNGDYSELTPGGLRETMDFIHHNITTNLSLEKIAKVAHCNKYGFAKKFRASTGMSPMNYVLMKKVFTGKKQITANSELTQIAYDYGFTDLAHFSKAFKRFVGISPAAYRKNIQQGR